jgi:hypothetical protein
VEMPAPERHEERHGGMAERCRGTTVESLLERTSGREASREDEWTRGYDVGLLGWCHGPWMAMSGQSDGQM